MKKLIIFIILFSIFTTGCNKQTTNNTKVSDKMPTNINITINNNEYTIKLEDNETTKEFIKLLPLNLTLNDLNNNEKYTYLDTTLPTNPINPKTINKGDVMLYQNNCLVIFYKTFETNYSYTKIGHIDNLEDLGSNNIEIKLY